MENLPIDVIVTIALQLDLPEVFKLCTTSTKINLIIIFFN